jgi:hypothetical protein
VCVGSWLGVRVLGVGVGWVGEFVGVKVCVREFVGGCRCVGCGCAC